MDEKRRIIGYRLEPMYETPRGAMTTRAFVLCSSCRGVISTTRGPLDRCLCLKCIDKLNVFNKLSQ